MRDMETTKFLWLRGSDEYPLALPVELYDSLTITCHKHLTHEETHMLGTLLNDYMYGIKMTPAQIYYMRELQKKTTEADFDLDADIALAEYNNLVFTSKLLVVDPDQEVPLRIRQMFLSCPLLTYATKTNCSECELNSRLGCTANGDAIDNAEYQKGDR